VLTPVILMADGKEQECKDTNARARTGIEQRRCDLRTRMLAALPRGGARYASDSSVRPGTALKMVSLETGRDPETDRGRGDPAVGVVLALRKKVSAEDIGVDQDRAARSGCGHDWTATRKASPSSSLRPSITISS
jgi:hypothetical protein